jgi:hypothetical protein
MFPTYDTIVFITNATTTTTTTTAAAAAARCKKRPEAYAAQSVIDKTSL